ncbi:MAG: DUF4097 family beta strand repeat-containing protein [Candidatus Latescibacterota bacterium]
MLRTHVLGIASLIFTLSGGITPAQAETTEDFHRTYPLPAGAPVRVSNSSGKVEIASWDQPYADIRAVKRTRQDRADLERISIEVHADSVLDIRTVYDRSRQRSRDGGGFLSWLFGGTNFGSQPWVDYIIRIPRTARLELVQTSNGDIEVRDAGGDAALQASSGGITVEGVSGMLDIRSSSGDITAQGCSLRYVQSSSGAVRLRDIQGDFPLKTSSGDVEITGAEGRIDAHSSSGGYLVKDARGTVSIETSSGEIRAENSVLSSVHTTSGDIRLKGVRGDLRIRTSSGTVQVTGTGGTVEAHSTSGNMWLEGFILRGASSSSGDIRIEAAGLADSVRLSSNSGDITVDIPDGVNASLVMETSSGDMVNRSGQPLATTMITRRRVAGWLGAGGAPLTVRTSSGDVVLK